MKTIRLIRQTTAVFLIAVVACASCKKDDPEPEPEPDPGIVIPDPGTTMDDVALTLAAFADQTAFISGITFTTPDAWESTVMDGTAKADGVTWLAIYPDHGDAGIHTVKITFEPNVTRKDRTASITVTCNGVSVPITVKQAAKKEDGTIPGVSPIDGNKITVTMSDIGDQVDEVCLDAYTSEWLRETLAKAEFKNDGFTLELPDPGTSQYLKLLSEFVPSETLSDPAAMCHLGESELYAYKDGSWNGYFKYGNFEDDYGTYVHFWYVDRDVTIRGTFPDVVFFIEQYNCYLKKGWNCVAVVYKGSDRRGKNIFEYTTMLPEGLKWYFY